MAALCDRFHEDTVDIMQALGEIMQALRQGGREP
jgi:hypothetical protein